jgi:hypothetical protein
MTFDDMVTAEDTNEAHAAACLAMWDRAGGYLNFGIYTPFHFRAEGAPALDHPASRRDRRRELGRPGSRSDDRHRLCQRAGHLAGRLGGTGAG